MSAVVVKWAGIGELLLSERQRERERKSARACARACEIEEAREKERE